MIKLPHWVITDIRPGFYDSESATAIEQTAKLYRAIQEHIDEFNKMIDELNAAFEAFEASTNKNVEEFKKCIEQMMLNHISCIDAKMDKQNKVIADAVDYMKNNIYINTYKILEQMFKDGLIYFGYVYDEETEDLTFTIDYNLLEESEVEA